MNFKDFFLLDPDVVFLNHGSFGAAPRPVFAAYRAWQLRLERQPVQFILNELPAHLAQARAALGAYVNAPADDLVYVPNATFGVNVVARSLALGPGDEVLATDHEYGACDNVWRFLSLKRGFAYVRQPIALPVQSPQAIVDQFWQGVTARTRLIFISHITSPTALRLPVEAICARAREAGILTLIDGAHAPGQIPLDMAALGADFYTGNAHKWLCSPKGSAFLYTRPERQPLIEPLVIGWGWGEQRTVTFGSDYLDYLQWLGTNDVAAYLATPDAITFQREHAWETVQARCHELLREARARIAALTGLPLPYPDDQDFYCQMAIAPLPPVDAPALQARLLAEFGVEVPLIAWNGRCFIRVSIQAYNTPADVDTLLAALETLLP